MTRRLEAWLDGGHVGQFIIDGDTTYFRYDTDAPDTPISLSFPAPAQPPNGRPQTFWRTCSPTTNTPCSSGSDVRRAQYRHC